MSNPVPVLRSAFEAMLTQWCMPGATQASKVTAIYNFSDVLDNTHRETVLDWEVSDAYRDMAWYIETFGLKPIQSDSLYMDRSVPITECIRRGLVAAAERRDSTINMEEGRHNQYTAAAEAAYNEMMRYHNFACGNPVSFGRRRRSPRRSSAMGRRRTVRRRSSAMGRARTVRRRRSATRRR